MCSIWKFVGVVALSFSLVYNLLILFVVVSFVLRCYDDCDTDEPPEDEEFATDCYGAYAIYTLYLPSLVSAPFIVMADFRNIYYLEWWLIFQAVLTFCSCLIFICYNPFYSSNNTILNFLGVAFLVISFIFVANHLFKVRRRPAVIVTPNPEETTA